MRLRRVIFLLAVGAIGLAVWAPWRQSLGYHFSFPLPATAKLLNYHHSRGLDSGNEFEFAVTDDAMRDLIIKQWNLKPVEPGANIATFAKFSTATWWPAARLDKLPERYGRTDQDKSNYWSLWVDRENGKLYAEYGNW